MKWCLILLLLLLNYGPLIAQKPRLVLPIGHTASITSFQYSPDGKYIITGSEDKTVKLWDANTGKLLQNFAEHTGKVTSVFFHPLNSTVFSSGEDGRILEYDMFSGKLINTITSTPSRKTACAISPDGKLLAYADDSDPAIITWSLESKKAVTTIQAHTDKITTLVFRNDSKELLSASYDNTVRVWDALSGKKLNEISRPASIDILISSACFSPDGKNILISTKTHAIELYETGSNKLLRKWQNDSLKVDCAAYSADGKNIASGAIGAIIMLDPSTLEVKKIFRDEEDFLYWPNKLCFNKDGNRIMSVSFLLGKVKVWDTEKGTLIYKLEGRSTAVYDAKFSRSGGLIVTSSEDNTAKMWTTSDGRLKQIYTGHYGRVKSASFSRDLGQVVSGSEDGKARITDMLNGKLIKEIKFNESPEYNISLSPDGKRLLTTFIFDTVASVYNVATATLIFTLVGHTNDVVYSCYSPDGKYIATASRDETIKLWDASNGELIRTLTGHSHWVNAISFSENSQQLISASRDSTAKIWNLATGNCLWTLKGHAGSVSGAAVNMKQNFAVTSSEDRTAKIWDLRSGICLFTLSGHTDELNPVSYSAEKKLILTSSKDNTCKIWDAVTGQLKITFFSIGSSADYFSLSADGYYSCSPDAAKLLHYVTPDLKVLTFDQLDIKYNRPDKIMQQLNSKDTLMLSAYQKAYFKRIKKLGIDTLSFNADYSVPTALIANAETISYQQVSDKLVLKVHAEDGRLPIAKFNIWINETPVFGMKGLSLDKRHTKSFDTTLTVTLSGGQNSIEISVVNVNGTESFRTPLIVDCKISASSTVYFIGIGINQFKEDKYNLSWSVKDIHDLASRLKNKFGNQLVVDTLYDDQVTVTNILAIKERLKKLGVNDKLILAYSGHGLLGKEFDYYLSTYGINFMAPEQNGLSYDALENLFDSIAPRKKIMLIDACHSGELDKDDLVRDEKTKTVLAANGVKGLQLGVRPDNRSVFDNSFMMMQRFFSNVTRSTGTTVISAAAGTQFALEKGDLKNGVFTYSILEAMDKYKTLSVQRLKKIVISRVLQLTNGLQKPTSRSETNSNDWNLW